MIRSTTTWKRRDFLRSGMVAATGSILGLKVSRGGVVAPAIQTNTFKPVAISSRNGLAAVEKAMEIVYNGGDCLDAAVAGVKIQEDDPEDTSVGYGGLPNERGVVQLDASVMHGPTHRAGAVGALENIRYASEVAKIIMERTKRVFLVGKGALEFARMYGFKEENLLTEQARTLWQYWVENRSKFDDYMTPTESLDDIPEQLRYFIDIGGTINLNVLDTQGNLGGCTTTSGLAFKIPGRVGDSPIIGAGLYVDNEFGAAGSTGLGEVNIQTCASFLVVEEMGRGKTPTDACVAVCRRIVDRTKVHYLWRDGRPAFNVNFYAVNKRGEFGCASILSGSQYAVHNEDGPRYMDAAYLYERE
jgi:N4-(beta-N-acetylglucosaminyl)-L-asparaginase